MAWKTNEQQRVYKREWYKRNKSKIIAEVVERKRKLNAEFVEYKKTLKCMKCGESDFRCLDFHHRDPTQKDKAVSALIAWSKKRLIAEIEKCDVLCANCHRKHHYAGVV